MSVAPPLTADVAEMLSNPLRIFLAENSLETGGSERFWTRFN